MSSELLLAFALFLVIEGIFPALNPSLYRQLLQQILNTKNEQNLRVFGISLMLFGALMIYFIKH